MDIKKASLEEKISKLAEHGKSLYKGELEHGPLKHKEKEIGKESSELGKEKIEPVSGASLPSSSGVVAPKSSASKNDKDIKGLSKNDQISSLVKLSFTKGIFYAVEEAKKLDDPYVLDELHDELVKQFKELVKSGKLKEV